MIIYSLIFAVFFTVNPAKPIDINDIKYIVHMLPIYVPLLLDTNYTRENVALQSVFNVLKFPYDDDRLACIYFFKVFPIMTALSTSYFPWMLHYVRPRRNAAINLKIGYTLTLLLFPLLGNAFMLWQNSDLNANTSAKLIAHCVLVYGFPLKYLWSL